MVEGFFRIAFTGKSASGFGILVLNHGVVAGADVAGVTYDGTYIENQEKKTLEFQLIMHAPAGVTPVQTGVPVPAPVSLPITGSVKQEDVGTERPTLMQTPLGPVNVLFQKIRELA
jgi:hypothetical protein